MGSTQTKQRVYDQPFEPILLKQLMVKCDISQSQLRTGVASITGGSISRATINLALNRGHVPPKVPGFKAAVEQFVEANPPAKQWLLTEGVAVTDIWTPLGTNLRKVMPAGHHNRTGRRKEQRKPRIPAMVAGDPMNITNDWEVEMITQETLKLFKMFRNPFIDDIQKDTDIYMSDEHRYIEAAMLDSARHGGFLAVIGEVGSGKSVMRRKVVEQLNRDNDTLVVFPQTIDKTRLTAGSICDAIIADISSEKPRITLEAKSRQVLRLLLDRAKSGYRAVLMIEEAHDLNVNTLKYLKRFNELEDGYRKLLGIILIGQTELKHAFNESTNVDMREVIRRVQVAEIRGLNGNLKAYLSVKFKRVGKSLEDIFAEDAFEALGQRMTSKSRDGKQTVSHAYPLLVNNYVARAMNMASEIGEARITADIVMAM